MRSDVRTLVTIIIMALLTMSNAFARKTHDRPKRTAAAKATDRGGIERHPDDVALDRQIKGICKGC